jgi:hypothetical protein
VTSPINRRDLPWVALVVLSFIIGLAFSWQRWGNPLVDCGREMNQPLRLAQGEMLYSDVRHIYGPLSPYLNAVLYRVFGPSLDVLYADGILSAALILALTYWLARKLMEPGASAAATLSVMWLCAFKQAGNYILPYSYGAVHGCLLGLGATALLIKSITKAESGVGDNSFSKAEAHYRLPMTRWCVVAAGVLAGLALLAKTEMGLAALVAGVAATALAGYPKVRRSILMASLFLAPAVGLVGGVYWLIAAKVGWRVLSSESFLFLSSLPPELVYFNKRISGFDEPLQSLLQMVVAAVRMSLVAVIVGVAGLLVGSRGQRKPKEEVAAVVVSRTDSGKISTGQLWFMLVGSAVLSFSIPATGIIGWDKGPYLAMPLILMALLFFAARNARTEIAASGEINANTVIFLTLSVYALSSLARVVLRVRSGGAYSSYLLPSSVILFTFAWAYTFAERFRSPNVTRVVRNIWIALILADVVATAPLLAHRFREKNTYRLATERGTIIAVPDLGQAFDEAIKLINSQTRPGDSVAILPEGTSLDFFTGRRNPLREEITTPGFLDAEGELRAIRQLEESDTRLVLVTNRPTPEFGSSIFGSDYCRTLMRWVNNNFDLVATLGPDKSGKLEIGDKTFFIRAYLKR